MKIRLCLKDPNGVDHGITAHAGAITGAITGATTTPDCARGAIEYVKEQIRPWIRHGEYVTIEIDTEAGTASVVPVNE